MPILLRKTTFLYAWAMGLFIGMQFDFCWGRFSGEVRSSLSEKPHSGWTSIIIIVERLHRSGIYLSIYLPIYLSIWPEVSRSWYAREGMKWVVWWKYGNRRSVRGWYGMGRWNTLRDLEAPTDPVPPSAWETSRNDPGTQWRATVDSVDCRVNLCVEEMWWWVGVDCVSHCVEEMWWRAGVDCVSHCVEAM